MRFIIYNKDNYIPNTKLIKNSVNIFWGGKMKRKIEVLLQNNFWRYMITYIGILIIIILIGQINYFYSYYKIKLDVVNNSLVELKKNIDLIDTNLKEVSNIAVQISIDKNIKKFAKVNKPLSNPDYYKMKALSDEFSNYRLTNTNIYDTYVFFGNSNIFLNASTISGKEEAFYNGYLKYSDLTFRQWTKDISNLVLNETYWHSKEMSIRDKNYSMISYIKKCNDNMAIVILIDERNIQNYLSIPGINKNGWMLIADERDNVITSYNNSRYNIQYPINSTDTQGWIDQNNKITVLYAVSPETNWKYVIGIPSEYFIQKVEYLKDMNKVTLCITLIIGLIIGIFSACFNNKPMKELISNLKMGNIENYNNEYDFIKNVVSLLLSNNRTLEDELKKQTPLLRNMFFDRLLSNKFASNEAIEKSMNYNNFKLEGEEFLVFVIQIENQDDSKLNEIDMAVVVINKILKQYMSENNYLYNIENNRIVVLYGINNLINYEKEVENIINEFINEINKYYGINVSVGIGGKYKKLCEVHKSFEEAVQALEYKIINQINKVLWYSKINKNSIEYYYPLEIEIKLRDMIKMGEKDKALIILEQLYNKNFIERTLSLHAIKQLLFDMEGTIIKLQRIILNETNYKINNLNKLFEQLESVEQVYQYVIDILINLLEVVNCNKLSHNQILLQKIKDFIEKNYDREDLSLYVIASQVNISEKYLSNFFKNQTGENISYYIEKVRMEKVKQLMQNDKLKISKIMTQVGYTNHNTFYKAFKRYYATNPSNFRKNMIN